MRGSGIVASCAAASLHGCLKLPWSWGLMENENILTVQFRLTRKSALLLLTFFFLIYNTGYLGSESLTLTTYYPAPYGGYVSLLTTGQTVLARDGGAIPSTFVRIGEGYPLAGGRRDTNVKLEVGGGNISTPNSIQWGSYKAKLDPAEGGSIELGGNGGNPYIDFSQSMSENYSARLALSQAETLEVTGDFTVTKMIKVCTKVNFALNMAANCPAGTKVLGHWPAVSGGACAPNGNLLLSGNLEAGARWIPHVVQECNGTMLCCRIGY